MDEKGVAAREWQARERASAIDSATELLKTEILRRKAGGEPAILKKQAEEFLKPFGIKQKIAREAIDSCAFQVVEIAGKGHPKEIRLAENVHSHNRNNPQTEPFVYVGSSDGDFGKPHKQSVTEIDQQETSCSCISQEGAISVESSLSNDTKLTDREILEI
jgi:hypothetical protein